MTVSREIRAVTASMSPCVAPETNRRRFLQVSGAIVTASLVPPVKARSRYRVGVGRGNDGYGPDLRAMDASGEWPAVGGKVVVIKPNLVLNSRPESGAVTDPEVVRAVVDRASCAVPRSF